MEWLERFFKALAGKNFEPDRTKVIPRPAKQYGIGPDYVVDTPPGSVPTFPHHPYSPVIGHDKDTLHDQRQLARYGQMRFYDERNAEGIARGTVERFDERDYEGLTENPPTAVAPVRPRPERWTAYGHDHYHMVRPWDQGIARQFTGLHFSMADHRRDYDIGGMEPVHQRRNTYRVEPSQWDINIVDKVENTPPVYTGYDESVAPHEVGSRASYRTP